MSIAIASVVLLAALLLAWRAATAGNAAMPRAGDAAPDFSLPDQHGTSRTLSQYRGS